MHTCNLPTHRPRAPLSHGPNGDLVQHALLVDPVAALLHEVEQLGDVPRPRVEVLAGVLLAPEHHHARGAVDLGKERLGDDHVAEVLLREVRGEVEELREAGHGAAAVVLGHHEDVVLNHAEAEVLPALLPVRAPEHLRLRLDLGGVGRGEGGPADDLEGGELLEELLVHGEVRQLLRRGGGVHEAALHGAVGRQAKEPADLLEHRPPLLWVGLGLGALEDALVAAADLEVVIVVRVVADHQLEVLDLELPQRRRPLRGILDDHALDPRHCLLLGLALDIVVCHLLLLLKGAWGDLLCHDLRTDEVLLVQAQAHLLQDEGNLLRLREGAVGLDRHLLHDVRCLIDLALRFLDRGQQLGQPGPLHLYVDLPRGDRVERGDELDALLDVVDLRHVRHSLLHHGNHRLLELRAPLRDEDDVLVQLRVRLLLEARLDDGHDAPLRAADLRRHTLLLLKVEEALERILEVPLLCQGHVDLDLVIELRVVHLPLLLLRRDRHDGLVLLHRGHGAAS
mmetsp:Transcript_13252/g.41928  ORF Transcript_13252/g.41928 Transcript_13252/m.41928 type:complete len:510 (+) Transcript_13252:201-1730(+)